MAIISLTVTLIRSQLVMDIKGSLYCKDSCLKSLLIKHYFSKKNTTPKMLQNEYLSGHHASTSDQMIPQSHYGQP